MKYFFGWNNIKMVFRELWMTLSNRKSLLSSKRVERFAFTLTALAITIACAVYEILKDKFSATEAIMLITPLLVAAGYNMSQTQKEKVAEKPKEGE